MTNEEIREFAERVENRKPDYEIDGEKYRKFSKKIEAMLFMIITDGRMRINRENTEFTVIWK